MMNDDNGRDDAARAHLHGPREPIDHPRERRLLQQVALGKRRRALRAVEVTFRGMAPRDAVVYFVRRCAAVRRLHGEALKASLQHLPAQGFQVALELRSGGRILRASAIHAAAIVAVCRAFESLR